jgi:sensor histidine kinase YesM
MLLQPFIENVFVHAFDSIQKPHTNNFFKAIQSYLCEIKDNGKGMAIENLNKLNLQRY